MWSSSCALLTMRSARCSSSSSSTSSRAERSSGSPRTLATRPTWSKVRPPYSTSDGLPPDAAARQGAHARFQLLERERLGEIIVGAEIETANAGLDAVLRGQDQHGQVRGSCARRRFSTSSPLIRGRPEVEDQQVELEARDRADRPRRRSRRGRPNTRFAQARGETLGQDRVVLGDQNAHPARPPFAASIVAACACNQRTSISSVAKR